MIRLIRWWLTASIRYSYRFFRAILRLPLLLLPIPPRVRNHVAGALAIALWFAGLYVLVAAAAAPWWGQLMVVSQLHWLSQAWCGWRAAGRSSAGPSGSYDVLAGLAGDEAAQGRGRPVLGESRQGPATA
ncbi:hypothetical protein [Arthrobacter sp. MDT3-44]